MKTYITVNVFCSHLKLGFSFPSHVTSGCDMKKETYGKLYVSHILKNTLQKLSRCIYENCKIESFQW